MNGKPCFPEWLSRLTRERYGPNYPNDIPYPVYTVQPTVLSADNPNGSAILKNDAYYQSAAGRIAVANLATTIIHVMPLDAYDTVNIIAFVSPNAAAGPPILPNLGVPIFFSFNKPGRTVTEVALNGSQEARVVTANVFDPADLSSYPTCIQTPSQANNLALNNVAMMYSNFLWATVKTDRPFWFWFADGLSTQPAGGTTINFNATWYVIGR